MMPEESRSSGRKSPGAWLGRAYRNGVVLAVAAGLTARIGLIAALFDWNGIPVSDDSIYALLAKATLETGAIPADETA